MKIIDLLNKIANGEEVPKKFKYDNLIFTKRWDDAYFDNEGDDLHDSLCIDFSNLNDEVEIIEEDKKIKLITMRADMVGTIENKIENLNINQMAIEDKINEIINILNKGDKEG